MSLSSIENAKSYQLRTVKDFTDIPLGRLADCMQDFIAWLIVSHIGRELKHWLEHRDSMCFTWIDDGEHNATVKITVLDAATEKTVLEMAEEANKINPSFQIVVERDANFKDAA